MYTYKFAGGVGVGGGGVDKGESYSQTNQSIPILAAKLIIF